MAQLHNDSSQWEAFVHQYERFPTSTELELAIGEVFYLQEHIERGAIHRKRLLVEDELLIDVSDTCNFSTATGIQRVVRNLILELERMGFPFRLVAWEANQSRLRTISEDEAKVAFGRDLSLGHHPSEGLKDPENYSWVEPRNCRIFVPELAGQTGRIQRLVAMSKYSSNILSCIAYDAVPVLLPDTAAEGMPGAFTYQMQLWMHAHSIFCISDATKFEIDGLLSGIAARNLPLPRTFSVPLPVQLREKTELKGHSSPAQLLVVGTHEPRKNHVRILYAAERLWTEGINFELHFIGSSGWKSELFWEKFNDLKIRNFNVSESSSASDEELDRWYQNSNALIFPSIHEGFGLPIAEAIHWGLPVVTSNRGSMLHLADTFGLHKVDSESVEEIADAMELALEMELPIPELQGTENPYPRDWNEYASRIVELLTAVEASG